jgi:aminopeptidase N
MVFLMLRDRIGQAKFDQGIRNFWIAQRFRIASWDDLQTAFEKAAGEKLGDFFAPWLEQQSLPGIAIQRAEVVNVGKQYQLDVSFSKTDASLPLRLPLEVVGAGKQQTLWIDLAARQKTATLKLDFQPQSLRLDPDLRVWRRLETSQLPPILRQWIAAKSPQLINVAVTPEAIVAVNQLSSRFFETPPQAISPADLTKALRSKQATLLAGTHSEVDQALSSAGLPARPATFAGQGSAQVWTVISKDYQLAVISGKDANAINALQRGLPHYGGQSWLIFDQGRATQKGVWPTSVSSIPVALTQSSKDKH